MKILIVNQVFYPDISATSQYLTDLALELSKQNHKVTVLTARCGYVAPWPLYAKRESYQGIRIIRVWPFRLNKKNRLVRILQSIGLNLNLALKLLGSFDCDRILALTSPPMVGWICALVARITGKKIIYWLMDINPDEAIEAGWIQKKSIESWLLTHVLKDTLCKSHRIICLDSFMKKRVVAKGADPRNIRVIPPWSHDGDLATISHNNNPIRKKNGLEGKFVVMYAGNHSVCHPLNTLLEAAALLKNDNSIVFVFCGGGERVLDVTSFKKQYQLNNIVQLPYQSRSDLKFLLSAADLHTVVMGNAFVGIVHPCKIYDILAVGRPFAYIGPQESHISDIINEAAVGYQVRHGHANELCLIIKEAMRLNEAEKKSISEKERGAGKKFSQQLLCGQLADLITEG